MFHKRKDFFTPTSKMILYGVFGVNVSKNGQRIAYSPQIKNNSDL